MEVDGRWCSFSIGWCLGEPAVIFPGFPQVYQGPLGHCFASSSPSGGEMHCNQDIFWFIHVNPVILVTGLPVFPVYFDHFSKGHDGCHVGRGYWTNVWCTSHPIAAWCVLVFSVHGCWLHSTFLRRCSQRDIYHFYLLGMYPDDDCVLGSTPWKCRINCIPRRFIRVIRMLKIHLCN